jgi:hypothetical protein
MDVRIWATGRGQTLLRTVDGMMLYEKALKLLAKLEDPGTSLCIHWLISPSSIHPSIQSCPLSVFAIRLDILC